MKHSEFWLIVKKSSDATDSVKEGMLARLKLPGLSIAELTSDEIVYLWSYRPMFDSLCLVCSKLNQRGLIACKTNVPDGYPCGFKAVPEAEMNQDFDDFLIDGEHLAECGYYYSIEDFKRLNGYSDEQYLFHALGKLPSIRAARKQIQLTLSQFTTSIH